MATISILGFGAFGQFIAKHIRENNKITVWNRSDKSIEAEKLNVKYVSELKDALESEIIILSVAMSNVKELIQKIKNDIKPNTTIIDVCSLKMFVCKEMEEQFPKDVNIVGTHPLFGPQSCANGIKGAKIAICNVRGNKELEIKEYCDKLGLKTYITTPEQHDKEMAYSQALTHFIGRISNQMKIQKVDLSTKTYDDFLDIATIVKNDDIQLFYDMQSLNPFAKKVREEFLENAKTIDNTIKEIK